MASAIDLGPVLVVEDSVVQLAHAIALCQAAGVSEVLGARNGRIGLDMLDQMAQPPALLIVDMVMPVMDGIAMIEALHERDIYIPVALASAMKDDMLHSAAGLIRQLGLPFAGTLDKPIREPALRALLQSLLPGRLTGGRHA